MDREKIALALHALETARRFGKEPNLARIEALLREGLAAAPAPADATAQRSDSAAHGRP